MATYRIDTVTDRGKRRIGEETCTTIHRATLLFMAATRAHVGERNTCVLLTKKRDVDRSETVLAHKSTDSDRTIFEPSYWRE